MTEILYHYTSESGLQGIRMSGYIRQTHTHPAAGLKNRIGVYFTKMKPNNSKIALIENNYRNYKGDKSKVTAYVKVWLPKGSNQP